MEWAENPRDLVHNLMRTTVPVASNHRLHCHHGVFDVRKSPTTYALTPIAGSYLGKRLGGSCSQRLPLLYLPHPGALAEFRSQYRPQSQFFWSLAGPALA